MASKLHRKLQANWKAVLRRSQKTPLFSRSQDITSAPCCPTLRRSRSGTQTSDSHVRRHLPVSTNTPASPMYFIGDGSVVREYPHPKDLLSVILVCRLWNETATSLLYARPFLEARQGLVQFSLALQGNTALGPLVAHVYAFDSKPAPINSFHRSGLIGQDHTATRDVSTTDSHTLLILALVAVDDILKALKHFSATFMFSEVP